MSELSDRIYRHVATMSPHIAARKSGELLKEAREEIVRLEAQLASAREFIGEVAGGDHSQLCPLDHPAYRHKWCHACEAKKLLEPKGD